jgi:signal peptidase II
VRGGVGEWRLALALCGAVVALDQGTKAIAESALVPGQRADFVLGVEFANVHNKGVAFGFFGDGSDWVLALTLVALAVIFAFLAREASQSGLWIPAGLLAGGALGNLADRIRTDAVTDFIDVPLWPTFNLADVAIVAGVVWLALAYVVAGREASR